MTDLNELNPHGFYCLECGMENERHTQGDRSYCEEVLALRAELSSLRVAALPASPETMVERLHYVTAQMFQHGPMHPLPASVPTPEGK